MQATPWPFTFGIPHFDDLFSGANAESEPRVKAARRNVLRSLGELIPAVDAHDHVLGDAHAPILLVEYGDYTCPRAPWAYETVKGLVRHFGSRLAYVFRHFPVSDRHPMAPLAAEAAEAAAEFGAFWKMHERLLSSPPVMDTGFLTWHAAAVGLNVGAFMRKLNLREFEARVADQAEDARRAGAKHPPTFFINGVKYEGPLEINALIKSIDCVRD